MKFFRKFNGVKEKLQVAFKSYLAYWENKNKGRGKSPSVDVFWMNFCEVCQKVPHLTLTLSLYEFIPRPISTFVNLTFSKSSSWLKELFTAKSNHWSTESEVNWSVATTIAPPHDSGSICTVYWTHRGEASRYY